jgi:DNA excision repair protein ERCC-2
MAAPPPPPTVTDGDWRDVFGHDAPYDEQVDGIETAISTGKEGGFLVLEGACGTGKTMLALTAGIDLVRDPDTDFERVLVLTSVKQQLRQFEQDIRTINANLPDDWRRVSGLTLVGKADVCPYNRENAGGIDDANVYDRCESLRERTRDLTDDTTAESLAVRARSQQIGLGDTRDTSAQFLETAGEPSPYPREMPEFDFDMSSVEYCPFYARYLADLPEEGDPSEAVPFDYTEMGLIDPEELVRLSVRAGTCPHSVMGALLPQVEVVIGNYYHAFDPTTTESFTGALLDDSTFVVCDEAHMLEPRVRDLVSDGVADTTLRDFETELTRVIGPLEFEERRARGEQVSGGAQARRDAQVVQDELNDSDVTLSELKDTRSLVTALREELDQRVTAHLDRNHRAWRDRLTDLADEEIPLRDPEKPAPDEITEWAKREGYDARIWTRAATVGAVVARVLNTAEEEEKRRAAPGAGRTLAAWWNCDHANYFREIDLERTWDDTQPADSWRRAYSARLSLHNCVPSDAIGERLADFGGGVLMSATLAPLEIFEEVTGLGHLEAGGRPVARRTYGLTFPAANRASYAVAAPKFTYANRGNTDEDTDTRRAYADAIRQVARVPGNVLVGMPSYGEAQWAAGVLEGLDKPVLLDESSADDATEDLKSAFFSGEDKVLVTSLRGTLTEGVDYRGDRLAAAVVCGVPIINTASPRTRAVRTAYDSAFGDGFRYALAVPAVRKARQAIGRVIRGTDETGVRVLVDERYARESWDSVRDLLGPDREEFQPVSPDMLSFGLERFFGG